MSDQDLEREIQFRTWFPKDVEFKPDGLTDAEVDRLLQAFVAFCHDCLHIKVPGKRLPFVLREAQLSTVRDWIANRNAICLKARQIGFSTLIAAFALWCVLGGSERQIYLLSKGQREARSLLAKARYAWRSCPQWVKDRPGTPKLIDRTVEKMTFDNDSFLLSAPSASDPIRGETAWLAVVDEWASLNDQEGAWAAIEPTADVGGRIIGLSTAKGEGDFFHRLWVGAETGNNSFKPIFHSWRAVPERDEAWYARKCAENEKWFVSQEYPSNPEEAFLGSGNPFFDLDLIAKMVETDPLGIGHVEFVDGVANVTPSDYGEYRWWRPKSDSLAYAIGADVAMGLHGGDWSVAYVFEAKSRKLVGQYRSRCHPEYFGEQILAGLGRFYNDAIIAPEVNNHGLTTLTALRNTDYPNVYRRRTVAKRQTVPLDTVGFMTTSATKPRILDAVAAWIRDGGQAFDRATIGELKTFVRDVSGNHVSLHGSPHDDCVMALALTLEACLYAGENNLLEVAPKEEGTIKWFEEQLKKNVQPKRLSPVR